ncbi:MAG: radical SAM protein, partial [Caldilineaceae bacterium]|nr:radical SAM protein [Caldilineaceae bacterium]
MKRVGILELLTSKVTTPQEYFASLFFKKQYISITPQAISVWCRQMGHRVYYATYYGIGEPSKKLPADLDIIFMAAPTHLANLAYALAKLYRQAGVRTVIGGPHAKSFPQACLRYFDLVVLACDQALIRDILNEDFVPGSIIASAKPYAEPPTIEERLPEIKASAFFGGRPHWGSSIPMLASVGCPYNCDFCTDWNVNYRALSPERLEADLRFAGKHLASTILYFHDPNFGVRFDETMDVFEKIPPTDRNQYLVESSLKLLNPERLKRLRDTNCLGLAPGIESWNGYSNKAGVGKSTGRDKLDRVVAQLQELRSYIPYLQANLILGLDIDQGDEPFTLTHEYLD